MKKRWIALTASAVFSLTLFGCRRPAGIVEKPPAAAEKSAYVSLGSRGGWDIAAENARYRLLYDPLTTAAAIEDKEYGTVYGTVPKAEEYAEVSGLSEVENEIKSALVLNYYQGNTAKRLLSFSDSVSKNQFQVFRIENGIRIEYTVGEAQSYEVFPPALTADYVEKELAPRLSDTDRELFFRYYAKQEYAQADEESRNGLMEQYPNFPQYDFYQRYILDQIPIKFRTALTRAFAGAGLNMEVMERESRLLGYTYTLTVAPSFFVPVEYRLHGDSMEATVCAGEIAYHDDFQLTSLDFLPFFGACAAREDGYALVPDGSGILVHLNNQTEVPISLPVFGGDLNRGTEGQEELKTESCCAPVFGCKQGDTAFFTVLSDGAAQADIHMVTSNNLTHLNRFYASYTLKERQTFRPDGLQNNWTFTRYAPAAYAGNITQRIYLLHGEEAGYEGMAALYRRLLFENRPVRETAPALLFETYGAISKEEMRMGSQTTRVDPFTTLEQLESMLDTLNDRGIGDICAVLRNWDGDPAIEAAQTGDTPHKQVGTKKQLLTLLERENTRIVPAFQVLYTAREPSVFSPLALRNCAAYSIQNHYLRIEADPDTNGKYAFNAQGIAKRMQEAGEAAAALHADGLLLSDIGRDLYSDFHKTNAMSRDGMKKRLAEGCAALSERCRLTIDGANAYALPYADTVLHLPLEDSCFYACDETVPFLPMVLSGYVTYAGEPLNRYYDMQKQFLTSLEFGAAPYFTLNWSDATILKGSPYAHLTGTKFSDNLEAVVSLFKAYEEAYGVVGSGITGHRQVAEDVFETTFTKGTLIVNYSDREQEVDGVAVEAKNFAVKKGEGAVGHTEP